MSNNATNAVLVARVMVGGETLVIKANKIQEALMTLNGRPVAGTRITADISFESMTEAEVGAVPEYQ